MVCSGCRQLIDGAHVQKRKPLCMRCFRDRQLAQHFRDPRLRLFNNARQRARRKGIEFTISLDDIVIPDRCPVLDIPLEPYLKLENKGDIRRAPSLDRIDTTRGYVPGNVAVISWKANTMKSDLTVEDVYRLAAYVQKAVRH